MEPSINGKMPILQNLNSLELKLYSLLPMLTKINKQGNFSMSNNSKKWLSWSKQSKIDFKLKNKLVKIWKQGFFNK